MQNFMMGATVALGLFALAGAATAAPQDGAARGRLLFLQCAACHATQDGAPPKVGPNLHGVVGAKAGARTDFAYSEALAKSGVVWTPAALDAWLKRPSALVPGNRMAFAGVPEAKDRADLIRYLQTATAR